MKTLDQLGTAHTFETSPQRIISLVPSQTELLYDLGQEAKSLVTKFVCIRTILDQLKSVGGTKSTLRKIRLLKPDIIICNKEEKLKKLLKD
jgi:ABC-type Fe3+-hydroxamate transport system substrate-binding protein